MVFPLIIAGVTIASSAIPLFFPAKSETDKKEIKDAVIKEISIKPESQMNQTVNQVKSGISQNKNHLMIFLTIVAIIVILGLVLR